MRRLALSADHATKARDHLARFEPKEGGLFFLLRSASTKTGSRLIATDPYLPDESEFKRVGVGVLTPTSALISKMVGRANQEGTGLFFVHSHPAPFYPAGFSDVDWEALDELASVMPDLLDGPFAAGVVSPHGWVASVLVDGAWHDVERVTSTGRCLSLLEPVVEVARDSLDDRQALALGIVNGRLQRLNVGLVGLGGLGSPLAETLARMGPRSLVLVDRDRIDTASNLRRIFGVRSQDLGEAPLKVDVVARHIRSLGLGVEVTAVPLDVRSREADHTLLDCDVVMCGTDNHASRDALNTMAYAFHLPVVDCGVVPGLRLDGSLEAFAGEIRIVGPGLPCLFCLGAIDADTIREENLPEEERERLAREGYGTGTREAAPSVCALTVSGAGWMASALIGLLADHGEHRASAYRFDPLNGFASEMGARRRERCVCRLAEGRATPAKGGTYKLVDPTKNKSGR